MPSKFIFSVVLLCCGPLIYGADTLTNRTISPLPKAGAVVWTKSLAGNWLFNPAPETGFEKATSSKGPSWKPIKVPGEWVMQGFKVAKHTWAGYASEWVIPNGWAGKRIKLRCDGIYSEAQVYVNGKLATTHIGGFTPFEVDVTDLLTKDSKLSLAIKVKNEGFADSVSAASSYAVHALGGITRKIQLVALSPMNISEFQADTKFDKNYDNATLNTKITLKNETKVAAEASLLFELIDSKTRRTVFLKQEPLNKVDKASAISATYKFEIPHPLKWDSEHPNLYTYRITLSVNGKVEEVTERKIGFRQIEVRGNQVFVNNNPVKLRGVCHHDIMPLQGRSVTAEQCVADVKIFAQGNVNYLRTSHYPPTEELVQACDSLGMFLEVEAPFCWAERGLVPPEYYQQVLVNQTLDMVEFFKSHPSVLIWSMGNESKKFAEYFKHTADLVKLADPSRPRNFSQYEPLGDNGELEIGNHHYPGPEGPEKYKNATRPIVFDEYCHLNAYNRYELTTDPGLRDAWGIGMADMWERMYAARGVLGGALWAGIDDTFVLPDSTVVGFGSWGVIDAWRRLKPEYWHMKKAYSPVRIKPCGNWENGYVKYVVENRYSFSNLNECGFKWTLGTQSGVLKPNIAPGKTDTIKIFCTKPNANEKLKLEVSDARQILIDKYVFDNIVPAFGKKSLKPIAANKTNWRYTVKNDLVQAVAGNRQVLLNSTSAGSLQVYVNQKKVIDGFAQLMVLPLNPTGDGVQMTGKRKEFLPYNSTAANHVIKKIEYQTQPQVFTIQIWDNYDEAAGTTTYRLNSNGKIEVEYNYTLTKDINPRQWGLVLKLAPDLSNMSWVRNGLWNYYPPDHIGRLSGTAKVSNTQHFSGPAGPIRKPGVGWAEDQNSLGTNDFRSTKMNIKELALFSSSTKLTLTSDGSLHSRCWRDTDKNIRVLLAGYSNLGAESFFHTHALKFETPLHAGNVIQNKISLEIK
jgi:beta-galactosidase